VADSDAEIVWVEGEKLLSAGVEPWSDMPLWLGGDPAYAWMDEVDPAPAVAAGLAHRPLDETIADTLAWHRAHIGDPGRAGFRMSREREAELV